MKIGEHVNQGLKENKDHLAKLLSAGGTIFLKKTKF